MGFNLNMDVHKLPHIWQTFLAMAFGGIFIASAAVGITVKLSKESARKIEAEQGVLHSIEAIEYTVEGLASTQQEILRSVASQGVKIDDYNDNLEAEVAKIRSTFMFYVTNVEKMTRQQMESVLSDVYGMGYNDGKKKEPIRY